MDTLVSIAIIAIACATIYIACHLPESQEQRHEKRVLRERYDDAYKAQFKAGIGSTFEFGLRDISGALGSPVGGGVVQVVGTVLDCDDEWVLIAFERSRKTNRAILRYSQIETLKELCA